MKANIRMLDRPGSGFCPMPNFRIISIIAPGSFIYYLLFHLDYRLQIIKHIVKGRDLKYRRKYKRAEINVWQLKYQIPHKFSQNSSIKRLKSSVIIVIILAA